jgi:hypothetical protein
MQVTNMFEMQAEMAYRQERLRSSIQRRPRHQRRYRHDRAGTAHPGGDARA